MSNSDSVTAPAKPPTREQILQAALACFANKGYHKTTMDDIVAESGLSKGSLYWHFKSKHDLFISLIDWFMVGVREDMAHAWGEDMTSGAKIRAVVMAVVDNSAEMIPFFKITLDFWAQTPEDEDLRQRFDSMLDEFQTQLGLIIEAGIASGEFRPIKARQLALALLAMIDSLVLYTTLLGDKIDISGSVETMLEILLKGLKP